MSERPKPVLASTSANSRKAVHKVLAHVRRMKPTQVVVWYSSPTEGTGVAISDGTERVKTMGALQAMIQDVWNG